MPFSYLPEGEGYLGCGEEVTIALVEGDGAVPAAPSVICFGEMGAGGGGEGTVLVGEGGGDVQSGGTDNAARSKVGIVVDWNAT